MSLVHEELTISSEPVQLTAPAVDPHFAGRRLILAALAVCVLIAVARLVFIDGWHRRISIDGPSMAPHWKNEHLRVRCKDCGHVWTTDASAGIPPAGFWCPNCGILQPQPEYATEPADRVLVDCWPLVWSEPLRWEVVALMAPSSDPKTLQASVKRIIGLPGEAVTIEDGDIWVNGKRPMRRLAQWRETAVVVHDDYFRVKNKAGEPETRWRKELPNSNWQVVENGYRYEPLDSAAENDGLERLVYHHERLHRGPHIDRTAPLDDDPYNQSPRELVAVPDLAISVWALVAPEANLELRFHDGQAWCTASWSAEDHEWTLLYGDEVLTRQTYSWHMRIPVHTEWIRLDGQLQLVINGRLVARHSIDGLAPSAEADEADAAAVSAGKIAVISASGGVVELEELQILRDIHYLSPLPASAPSADRTWFLGADNYLVLGDNPPVSVDSRHWPGGSVARHHIWGVIRRPQ